MWNKGVELGIGYNKKIGKVNLKVSGNVSYLKNQVTTVGVQPYLTGPTTLVGSAYELHTDGPGTCDSDSFYGFKTLGIFQNQATISTAM
jgi:hypothetical protein